MEGEYERLSDGEIQDQDAYSEISSDENFPEQQDNIIDLEQVCLNTVILMQFKAVFQH